MSGAIMNKVWDLFKMPAEDKDDEDAVDYDEVLDKDEKELVEIANEPKRSKNAKEAQIIKKPTVSKGKSGTKVTRITAKDNKRRGKKWV